MIASRKIAPIIRKLKAKDGLDLPPAYAKLFKIFVGLETVLSYLKSRGTIPILYKIQKSVEQQASRYFNHNNSSSFRTKQFAQIVSVYPEGYKLSSVSVPINDERVQSVAIEFPSDPVSELFLANLDRTSQPFSRAVSGGKLLPIESKTTMVDAVKKFTDQTMIRKLEFLKKLEDRVRKCHEVFK